MSDEEDTRSDDNEGAGPEGEQVNNPRSRARVRRGRGGRPGRSEGSRGGRRHAGGDTTTAHEQMVHSPMARQPIPGASGSAPSTDTPHLYPHLRAHNHFVFINHFLTNKATTLDIPDGWVAIWSEEYQRYWYRNNEKNISTWSEHEMYA